jgi:hypothetical protein
MRLVFAPIQTPLAAMTLEVPTVSPFLTTKLFDIAMVHFPQGSY